MHKMECVAMVSYGENWCPSETVRLVARMIQKQVGHFKRMNIMLVSWRKLLSFCSETLACFPAEKHSGAHSFRETPAVEGVRGP